MGTLNIIWREHRAETATTWIGHSPRDGRLYQAVIVAEAGFVSLWDTWGDCRSLGDYFTAPARISDMAARKPFIADQLRLAWERAADLATIRDLTAECAAVAA